MDMKITPPTTTTDRPVLAVPPAEHKSGGRAAVTGQQHSSTEGTQAPQVDTSATAELVELAKHEALANHERMLEQLQRDIASGDYNADLDVVAERVADVLDAT